MSARSSTTLPGLAVLLALAPAFSQAPRAFREIRLQLDNPAQEPGAVVIRSADQWNKFLKKYGGSRLPVSFARTTVIAVFGGERPNGGFRVRIDRLESAPDKTVVHHRVVPPPPDSMNIMALDYPYSIVRIDRRLGEVEFRPELRLQ